MPFFCQGVLLSGMRIFRVRSAGVFSEKKIVPQSVSDSEKTVFGSLAKSRTAAIFRTREKCRMRDFFSEIFNVDYRKLMG